MTAPASTAAAPLPFPANDDGARILPVSVLAGRRLELRTLPDGRRYWCVAPDDDALVAAARGLAVIADSATS